MKFAFFTFMLLVGTLFCSAQIKQVSGRITDDATGEPLPAVTVSAVDTRISTASNSDGHFVLAGPFNLLTLRFSCIGYQPLDQVVKPGDRTENINIRLKANAGALQEVHISAESSEPFKLNQQPGMIRLNPKLIATLPSFGEKDIFRAFQLMPGVSAGNEQS
ncbi:MAG TPA: carboxypeptidase-like regulatory domain-containing protein, partial [Sphingobacteriaceae bacterium]